MLQNIDSATRHGQFGVMQRFKFDCASQARAVLETVRISRNFLFGDTHIQTFMNEIKYVWAMKILSLFTDTSNTEM